MAFGKIIELFLVNGTADSLVTAELYNWNGKAIKIPRLEVAQCQRDDIKGPGVYFLFCKGEDADSVSMGEDPESVYIGESENVRDRLIRHLQDYDAEKEKYYWSTAVVFVGKDLNKTLIRYLENKLVQNARDCKRCKVLTKNTYSNTVIKESQIAAMNEFCDNIKVLINALGYKVLEPKIQATLPGMGKQETLYLNLGNASAKGVETTEGFVVFAGAKINEKTHEKSLNKGAVALRKRILASDKVKDLTTTEDILFTSSSAAADFISGYSISGPSNWKNKDGVTLKEMNSIIIKETGI